MRDIKFRGLRVDGAGWVYGYYLVKAEKHIIWSREDIQQFYVKPKSVGQFTGLQDKNGVDIYEGDKIELDNNWSFVIYSKVYCGFIFNSYMPQGLIHNLYKASNLGKVIGNINQS